VSSDTTRRIVEVLLDRHGRTYASEAGIRLRRNTPAPLFQLLCLSLLLSARIRAEAAVSAATALRDAGWTTPDAMADSTWAQRTKVLNRAGYARYDESTSRMLGQTVDLLRDRYRGDLRRLRDDAERDPDAERRLLQEFTGIGGVGASIFSREVQLVWDEQYPYADDRALETAEQLGLGHDVSDLTGLVDGPDQLTTLVAALVRCGLADDVDDVVAAAESVSGSEARR
jgi:endonuclease III